MKYEAYIKQMLVESNLPIIVYGQIRGLVSQHRSMKAAFKNMYNDDHGCKKQVGYSDTRVYEFKNDEWFAVED